MFDMEKWPILINTVEFNQVAKYSMLAMHYLLATSIDTGL